MKALESCVCLKGKVVKGFQRGSKLLGWPTANLDPKAFENKIDHLDQGVYFGLAKIATHEKVFKTALSVGWNPHFKNKEKTVEAYLVNEFKEDFYGVEMRLMIVGHVRPQIPFDGLESLKKAIQGDVDATVQVLELQKYAKLYTDDFFSDSTAKSQL
uniref:riboflavin kinase n=1 Tax=Amorphochlora amoebiformis TaxID=1561963 RepID=A0A6T6RWZ6_9EUKA